LKEISSLSQPWKVEDTLILSTTETWSSRLQTVEIPRNGTSINNPRLSELDTTTNHGISRAQVEPRTCKSGAPTLDGSKFSNSKVNSLSILLTIRSLMLHPPRIKKVKPLLSTVETETTSKMLTKDGRLSTLINPKRIELKDSTRNSDSTSTDHSTSDQECQCKELLNATVPTTFG
jgi:hypothetical protein